MYRLFGVILEIYQFKNVTPSKSIVLIIVVSNRYTKPSSKVYSITDTLIFLWNLGKGWETDKAKFLQYLNKGYVCEVMQLIIFTKLCKKKFKFRHKLGILL